MSVEIRIVVADDHEVVRAGFAGLLATQQDFAVAGTAGDGAEAVRICRELRPDVVLMDVRMPGMDGIEATRQLAGLGDGGPRVLILTTFDLDEYVYDALCAGASGFVLKDDPPEQLLAAIRVVAAGDSLLSPAVTARVIKRFTQIRTRPAPPGLEELTERELEVLRLVARGFSNAEIGKALFIGETTVKTHVTHILQKLDLRDRVQAVVLAYQTGLADDAVEPPAASHGT